MFSKKEEEAVIRWTLIPWPELNPKETIRHTEGYWLIKKAEGFKNRALLIYRVSADPGDIPPGLEWIVNFVTKNSIPDLMESVRQYVSDPAVLPADSNERRHLSHKPLLSASFEQKVPRQNPETLMRFSE